MNKLKGTSFCRGAVFKEGGLEIDRHDPRSPVGNGGFLTSNMENAFGLKKQILN